MEQLLATKFYIPAARPQLVSRPRLIERLNDGLYRKMTLISAPAGFGKTTLVTEWVEDIHSRAAEAGRGGDRIVWLSLDEGDNEPVRFLTYFIAALNQNGGDTELGRGALSMLRSPQPPSAVEVLIALINDLTNLPEKIIFILDDYHLIEAEPIHKALVFLLENLPRQLHLVIATRQDPSLFLGRMRARDQLTELRAADLRFSASEAAEFLNRVMSLNLSPVDIAELESRTEGWIVGLQLAAISMQGRKDHSGFIKSFTGSNRLVLDYLVEDVINQQPKHVQDFLLQTAILNRLSAPLCDALTGQENGQETLEMLDRANLFLIPLDEQRCWFRYHHLFADLLRQRLRQTQAEKLITLHRKSCEWYRRNGAIEDAIEHALQGEDFEQAAQLIGNQFDTLFQRGEHGKLRRWIGVLPERLLFSELQLGLIHAYYLYSLGKSEAGERLLGMLERILAPEIDGEVEGPPSELARLSQTEWVKLRGRLSAIRGLMSAYSGDVREMIQHANQALELLPQEDLNWRILAAFALGDAHSFMGDMAASFRARSGAVRACEAAGDVYYIIMANLKLASTLREQGELQRTLEICKSQVELGRKHNLSEVNSVGFLLTLWGEVLAEMDRMDEAVRVAMQGAEIVARGANIMILGFSYLYLMRVLLSAGRVSSAEEYFDRVARLDQESMLPAWLPEQMAIWRARMWLEQDDIDAATRWAEDRGLKFDGNPASLPPMDYALLFEYILLARILLAQNRLDEAGALLEYLLESAESGGRTARVIEILLLQAKALQASGEMSRAMDALGRAMELAEPRGFLRAFVDEGLEMAQLLYEALSRGIAPGYARRLLSAFPITDPAQTVAPQSNLPDPGLIEPLSERELEVLRLIAEGMTNPEIAARIFISLHTVKTHTRNIYGKLDAHNRTEAVARARALGILFTT